MNERDDEQPHSRTSIVSSTKQIFYFQLSSTLSRHQHYIKANRTEGMQRDYSRTWRPYAVSYNTAIYRTFPGIIAVVNRITHNNYRRPSARARDSVRSVWSVRSRVPVRRRAVPTPSWARSGNAPKWKPFLWHSDQKTINFGVTLSLGWWFRFCPSGARSSPPTGRRKAFTSVLSDRRFSSRWLTGTEVGDRLEL